MANEKRAPAFMFYPRDFASDGRVEAMATEAVGAYMLILCKAWFEDPAGSVPDDEEVLANWARLSLARWRKLAPRVLACFTKGEDGRLHQKRMEEVAAERAEWVEKSRIGGRKGAARRWGGHEGGNGGGQATAMGVVKRPPIPNDNTASASALTDAVTDVTERERSAEQVFYGQAKLIVKDTLWQGSDPPSWCNDSQGPWTMRRELSVVKNLIRHEPQEIVLDAMKLIPEIDRGPPEQPRSMKGMDSAAKREFWNQCLTAAKNGIPKGPQRLKVRVG